MESKLELRSSPVLAPLDQRERAGRQSCEHYGKRNSVEAEVKAVEPEVKAAVNEADPPSPIVETGLGEVQTVVTTGASLGEDVPPRHSSSTDESHPNPPSTGGSTPTSNDGSTPHAEIPLNSPVDEPRAATDKVTDGKLPETESLVEDKTGGDGCTETQLTRAKERPTRKRKRPEQPFMTSKRQKTALFSPMEIELQSLEQMFAALRL
ncbi:uncharacterized protein LOC134250281 [Saccostrea cucullata]|uniref:uncharacterized protein LOC134250281 n=1 Tax=Saccostrea cuccullata TaxID=36930 RepID=UPI002ED4B678